ncbi:MAG TPA: hypothetical protein VGD42_23305 [Lysobacter sp.]
MPLDTFCAYDDAGNRYTIHVRRTYIDARGSEGRMRVEGLRSYHLGDGGAVDRLDDERYAIVATGLQVRRARARTG